MLADLNIASPLSLAVRSDIDVGGWADCAALVAEATASALSCDMLRACRTTEQNRCGICEWYQQTRASVISVLWAPQAYPHISLVAAVFQFAEYEQIVTTIVRMKKIDLNFKDLEPEVEELTAHRVVAHIVAKQNTVWSWSMQQRQRAEILGAVVREWRSPPAQANEAGLRHSESTHGPRTGQTESTAEKSNCSIRTRNHRTRRMLKLARQAEDLVRQLHRHLALDGGLSVVPWSMLRLWEKSGKSGEGLLSEARWDVVRQHHSPISGASESLGIQP